MTHSIGRLFIAGAILAAASVGGQAARALLSTPVEGTLWFGGEGLYEGDTPGTVEAAFSSGLETAKKIIAQS